MTRISKDYTHTYLSLFYFDQHAFQLKASFSLFISSISLLFCISSLPYLSRIASVLSVSAALPIWLQRGLARLEGCAFL